MGKTEEMENDKESGSDKKIDFFRGEFREDKAVFEFKREKIKAFGEGGDEKRKEEFSEVIEVVLYDAEETRERVLEEARERKIVANDKIGLRGLVIGETGADDVD